MKNCVIVIIALTMLIKPLSPVVEYVVNYNYITTVLCVNKAKPQLQCNGKCYLAEQLKKSAEQNQDNPFGENNGNSEIVHPIFFQTPIELDVVISLEHQNQHNFYLSNQFISTLWAVDITQPPESC
ncbi:hypothetical protein [Flagellimonas flava]|nr:hypothetical protein [Allomuricauda flava]